MNINTQIEQPKIKEEEKKDPGEMQEIRIGNIQLTQYTMNTLNNPYDTPLRGRGNNINTPEELEIIRNRRAVNDY